MMLFVLAGCRSLERKIICNEVARYQIEMTDSYFYRKGHCYKAPLDVNRWETKEDLIEVDLSECDGVHGVKATFAISEIQPKFTALQRLREESCAAKQKAKN